MAIIVEDNSIYCIRGLFWALGRQTLVKDKPLAFKFKRKKSFLELKLMSAYEQVEKVLFFIDAYEKANSDLNSLDKFRSGQYMKLLVKGIRLVMDSFVPDLQEAEKALLLNSTIIAVETLSLAQLMYDTFLLINHITQQISDGKLVGCQILDVCYKCHLKAEAITRKKIEILCRGLHREMLKQICCWVLMGELSNLSHEFFIKRTSPIVESIVSPPVCRRSSLDSSMSSEFCESLVESTSASLPFDKINKDFLLVDVDQSYCIDAAYVPSHLPYSVIAKIFSLGKFMIQIKNNPSNKIPVDLMTFDLSDYGLDTSEVRTKFKALEDFSTFHHHSLESVVDLIWCKMNKHLRKLAEEEGDLSTHHRHITDVYLMGRGELFRHFLDSASPLLLKDSNKVFSRGLDLALERVAKDLYGTDDVKFLKRFHFTLPPRGSVNSGVSTLSVMKLVYKSPWPLGLLYTQSVIETYNTVFIFLLNLKRAHRVLTLVWNAISAIPDQTLKKGANQLHFCLTSLLTNLQSYVFVDVILSETDSFNKVLQESDHFEEIQMSHAKFLSNIVMRLFLPASPQQMNTVSWTQSKCEELKTSADMVHRQFNEVFTFTHEFSTFVNLYGSGLATEEGAVTLSNLSKNYDSLVVKLISLVKTINEKFCSEHLSTLLMRLDYNNYYSNKYKIYYN